MAQSALTVTPPNPTPPTNMVFAGVTGPNPPNYTKVNYAEPNGDLDANGLWTGTSLAPGDRKNPNPPPYTDVDAGAAGPLQTFAAAASALAGGTSTTSGGTEGTYPGTGTGPNGVGAVPASTSVAHEGRRHRGHGARAGQHHPHLRGRHARHEPQRLSRPHHDAGDARRRAERLARVDDVAATNPAFASLAVATAAAAPTGTQLISCVGTNFVPGCRIWVNNVERTTTYVSATSITATINKATVASVWRST